MADIFKYSYNDITEASTYLGVTVVNEYNDQFQTMSNTVQNVIGNWNGKAKEGFNTMYTQNTKVIQDAVSELLRDMQQKLAKAVEVMQDADNQLGQHLSSQATSSL